MNLWKPYDCREHGTMTRRQVRDYDDWAIRDKRIPGIVLMENAGRSAAEIALSMLPKEQSSVCIFCGAGNNGGDGFVIARHLANYSIQVRIILCASPEKIAGDALINLTICKTMAVEIIELDMSQESSCSRIESLCCNCSLIIDAIFGTGLRGELSGPYIALIGNLNSLATPILAVDIPSGLDCDRGIPLPVCIHADATVSFVAAKPGFLDGGGVRRILGRLYIASIGITGTPGKSPACQ